MSQLTRSPVWTVTRELKAVTKPNQMIDHSYACGIKVFYGRAWDTSRTDKLSEFLFSGNAMVL